MDLRLGNARRRSAILLPFDVRVLSGCSVYWHGKGTRAAFLCARAAVYIYFAAKSLLRERDRESSHYTGKKRLLLLERVYVVEEIFCSRFVQTI